MKYLGQWAELQKLSAKPRVSDPDRRQRVYISPENQAKVNRVTARILRQALALNVHREMELPPFTQVLVEQALKEEATRLEQAASKIEFTLALGSF